MFRRISSLVGGAVMLLASVALFTFVIINAGEILEAIPEGALIVGGCLPIPVPFILFFALLGGIAAGGVWGVDLIFLGITGRHLIK